MLLIYKYTDSIFYDKIKRLRVMKAFKLNLIVNLLVFDFCICTVEGVLEYKYIIKTTLFCLFKNEIS